MGLLRPVKIVRNEKPKKFPWQSYLTRGGLKLPRVWVLGPENPLRCGRASVGPWQAVMDDGAWPGVGQASKATSNNERRRLSDPPASQV